MSQSVNTKLDAYNSALILGKPMAKPATIKRARLPEAHDYHAALSCC